jgi:Ca2+-binding EF-hand superfamily protein
MLSAAEFRAAVGTLGLAAHGDQIDALFAEFDLDGNGAISFRELNKTLRKDARKSRKPKAPAATIEIADVGDLRRSVRHGLLSISNAEVFTLEDPMTGNRVARW